MYVPLPGILQGYLASIPSVGTSSARQRNAIKIAFHWHAGGGPFCLLGIDFLMNTGADFPLPLK